MQARCFPKAKELGLGLTSTIECRWVRTARVANSTISLLIITRVTIKTSPLCSTNILLISYHNHSNKNNSPQLSTVDPAVSWLIWLLSTKSFLYHREKLELMDSRGVHWNLTLRIISNLNGPVTINNTCTISIHSNSSLCANASISSLPDSNSFAIMATNNNRIASITSINISLCNQSAVRLL